MKVIVGVLLASVAIIGLISGCSKGLSVYESYKNSAVETTTIEPTSTPELTSTVDQDSTQTAESEDTSETASNVAEHTSYDAEVSTVTVPKVGGIAGMRSNIP